MECQLEDTFLRHKIREYARQQRQELRTHATDALRFGLGQIKNEIVELEKLEVKDVNGMASRIKRRKHATSQDMYRLSHAFLQGNENINAFAEKQGATQVLIKELTGTSTSRQVDAAECICNYSLGEAHVCEKITSLAGSYLVTYLDSKEPRLQRSCLWTLTNILATSAKAAKTLLQMQLVQKLWKLYTASADALNECQEDAGTCLYIIATNAADWLSDEDRHYIAQHLQQKNPSDAGSEFYMYIVFQTDILGAKRELCEQHCEHLWHFVSSCLHNSFATDSEKLRTVYAVRVLSNLLAVFPARLPLAAHSTELVQALNRLLALRDPQLTMDLLQLVRNIVELNLLSGDSILDQLRVYAVES